MKIIDLNEDGFWNVKDPRQENLNRYKYEYSIPESFNTNISHQLFDCKRTFVNSQCKNANSKGDFVLKNRFETFGLKISCIQNKSVSDLV